MRVYVLLGDYYLKNETNVFITRNRALTYFYSKIRPYWIEKGFSANASEIEGGYQILITDSRDELVATYYILRKRVI